jgi:hypothetical protein
MGKTINHKYDEVDECRKEFNKKHGKKMTKKQYQNSPEGRLINAIFGKVS